MTAAKVKPSPAVTTMRLPPDLMTFAGDEAAKQGISRTQYIIDLLAREATKAGYKLDRNNRFRRTPADNLF